MRGFTTQGQNRSVARRAWLGGLSLKDRDFTDRDFVVALLAERGTLTVFTGEVEDVRRTAAL